MTDIETIKAVHPVFEEASKLTTLKRKTADEWDGPCPKCGGKDRFTVNTTVNGWFCRQCFVDHAWNDVIDLMMWYYDTDWRGAFARLGEPSPDDMQKRAERAKQVEAELEAKIAEAQEALADIRRGNRWQDYRNNLNDFFMLEWARRGLDEEAVDLFNLGAAPNFWGGASLTIPVFSPTGDLVNIRHRVLNPKDGAKYLPERAGLPAALYFALPALGVPDTLLLVEGEIKAMVTYRHLPQDVQAIGMPGMTPRPGMLDALRNAGRVFFVPDPDAQPKACRKIVDEIGRAKVRVIDLPGKIDDLIVSGLLTGNDLTGLMRTARAV